MRLALSQQSRVEALRPRLMERDESLPLALPSWALDPSGGPCTTLVLLAPPSTQFVLRVAPWQGLPDTFASSAGAAQLTRCGRDRVSLLALGIEMRSPRAAVYSLVAVGAEPPPALIRALPERDPGQPAALGEPGSEPARQPLAERLRSFERKQQSAGAQEVRRLALPASEQVRLVLSPGCHRLLATQDAPGKPYVLELREGEDSVLELDATAQGDVQEELCTARERTLLLHATSEGADVARELSIARFPLPAGLPGRFGPEAAARLTEALGGAEAPRRLGTLVLSTLGAQGRTPLPRRLLPASCYTAAALALHGEAYALSIGARAGAGSAESTRRAGEPGPSISFCTDRSGEVDLDVEARGLGVVWLFLVFHVGPSQAEPA